MNEIIFNPLLLFIFNSPQEWILVIVAVALLFGANKLPELAKSLGQTRKAFKEGMREADEEENKPAVKPAPPTNFAQIDDEALLGEFKRRQAERLTE